jgi:hypothetical protein
MMDEEQTYTSRTYPTACVWLPEGWYTRQQIKEIASWFEKQDKALEHSSKVVDKESKL